MNRIVKLATAATVLGSSVACDYTGDWLFAAPIEGGPGVIHIVGEDGNDLVPSVITTVDELKAANNAGAMQHTPATRKSKARHHGAQQVEEKRVVAWVNVTDPRRTGMDSYVSLCIIVVKLLFPN